MVKDLGKITFPLIATIVKLLAKLTTAQTCGIIFTIAMVNDGNEFHFLLQFYAVLQSKSLKLALSIRKWLSPLSPSVKGCQKTQ